MKELWTGFINKKDELPTYIIRFKTDSKKEYEALQEFCRQILDTDKFRILEALERLNKICKK